MQRRDEVDIEKPDNEVTVVETVSVKVKPVVEDFRFGKADSYRESLHNAVTVVLFQWPTRVLRSLRAIGALALASGLSLTGIVFILCLLVLRFFIETAMLMAGVIGYLDWRPSDESIKTAYTGALTDHIQKYHDAGMNVTDVKIVDPSGEDTSNKTLH